MRNNKLRAQIGYKRRYIKGGKVGKITDNILDPHFAPDKPNQAWLSDITYVRTHAGFLYVAMGLDLFSRRIVGWSMDKTMERHLGIRALMMAVGQRQPKQEVLVPSDHGSQYASHNYLDFMRDNNLKPSMSRRGNCHDNAVAESFFAAFKTRVIKPKVYSQRDDAKTEIFNFIEMVYDPLKRHSHTGGVSSTKYKVPYFLE
jgi:putative transposase